jgi:hypothetical protein
VAVQPVPFDLGRRTIAQPAVGPLLIMLAAEDSDLRLGLGDRGEGVQIEALITQRPIEALPISGLLETAWVDVQRRGPVAQQPQPRGQRDKLRAVVAAQVRRCPRCAEVLLQDNNDALGWQRGGDVDRQALACDLVGHRQQPERRPAQCRVVHEVVRPDVPRILGQHLARRTETALQRIVCDEGALDRLQLIALPKPLDGRDRWPLALDRQGQAALHGLVIQQDGASAALPQITARLGTGALQLLAQGIQQGAARLDG